MIWWVKALIVYLAVCAPTIGWLLRAAHNAPLVAKDHPWADR